MRNALRAMSIETRRRYYAKWDLEEARWAYWRRDYKKAARLLFAVMAVIVNEPLPDSEEYRNGEKKTSEPEDEPEIQDYESEGILEFDILGPDEGLDDLEPERDNDGYLIR